MAKIYFDLHFWLIFIVLFFVFVSFLTKEKANNSLNSIVSYGFMKAASNKCCPLYDISTCRSAKAFCSLPLKCTLLDVPYRKAALFRSDLCLALFDFWIFNFGFFFFFFESIRLSNHIFWSCRMVCFFVFFFLVSIYIIRSAIFFLARFYRFSLFIYVFGQL